jgi:cystathionine beta-lyase
MIKHKVKLYILSNPHNPGGRVWRREELQKIGEICRRHEVKLVSDEIHQDLTLFGHQHLPFNTINPSFKDFALLLSSATKSFNIAGTKCAYAVIENETLREAFLQARLANNQHEISALGLIATETAYREGADWLTELKKVLETNIDTVVSALTEKTKISVMKSQGTYLVWLDFSAYGLSDAALYAKLHDEAKVILNQGISFGAVGSQHARFNAAAPLTQVQKAVERIVTTFG